MGPDELHGKLHEGCHTNGWFHVVGEYEEGSASGDNTAMKCHTDAAASHGKLGHTCLEEGSGEIAFGKGVGLLQEAIGLVGIG